MQPVLGLGPLHGGSSHQLQCRYVCDAVVHVALSCITFSCTAFNCTALCMQHCHALHSTAFNCNACNAVMHCIQLQCTARGPCGGIPPVAPLWHPCGCCHLWGHVLRGATCTLEQVQVVLCVHALGGQPEVADLEHPHRIQQQILWLRGRQLSGRCRATTCC